MEKENNIIVQSLWIGKDLSLIEILTINSFICNNMEFHLYVYDFDIKNIPYKCKIMDANTIVNKGLVQYFMYDKKICKSTITLFSNYFRYNLLYKNGGYWVDMDFIVLKNFNDFIDDEYLFSSEKNTWLKQNGEWVIVDNIGEHVNCGIIKVPQQAPLIQFCLDKCNIYLNKRKKNKLITISWGELGPLLIKQGIDKYNLHKYIRSYYYFCPINYNDIFGLLSSSYILSPSIYEKSYCIHLWNKWWLEKNVSKYICNNKDILLYEFLLKYNCI